MSTIKRSVLTKGRRTGVVVASPGQIPVDDDGLEDIEAFWNSEQQQEPSGDGKDEYEGKKKQKLTRQEIGDPKYDEHGVTTKDMSAEEKEKYYSLAEKVLVRQRKQQLRGVLSPGAQSVGTEMTEVSAVTMGNISVASPEIVGGDDVNEDSKKTGQRLSDAKSPAGSFGVGSVTSPMTPGDNSVSMSISNSFMSNKTEGKSKKLDTLLENDEDDEGKDDDLISSQKVDNTPTSSGKSINDQPDFYIDADHNNDDDNDNDFDYGADVESKQDDHFEQKSLVGENEDDSFTNKRGKRSPKDLREPTVASEDEESSYEKRKKKKQRSLTKKRKKQKGSRAGSVSFSSPMSVYLPAGPREFEDVPVSDFKRDNSSDDEEEGVRRSKRARFTPLQFWKNERVVYGPNEDPTIFGNMPIIATVQQALPTPMKRIVKAKPGKKKNISGDEVKANAAQKVIKQKKFDKRKLNKNYNYVKGEYANIWDEGSREFSNISEFAIILICNLSFLTNLLIDIVTSQR